MNSKVQEQGLQLMSANEAQDTAKKYLAAFTGAKLTNEEADMFINMCRELRLNPFKKEAHIVAYGQGDKRTFSIITGFEVYLKRANATGLLDGWKVTLDKTKENELTAKVVIHRKDYKEPFEHEVYFNDVAQRVWKDGAWVLNSNWGKQPRYMLKKCAISQGFRLCFPETLGGMPYTEFEDYEPVRDVTPPEKGTSAESLAAELSAQADPEPAKEEAPKTEPNPVVAINPKPGELEIY